MTDLEIQRLATGAAQQLLNEANGRLIDAFVTINIERAKVKELEAQLAAAAAIKDAKE